MGKPVVKVLASDDNWDLSLVQYPLGVCVELVVGNRIVYSRRIAQLVIDEAVMQVNK